jgi:hypothetical protein
VAGWAVWAKEKEERARALVDLASSWAERGEGDGSWPEVKIFVFLFLKLLFSSQILFILL